MRRRTGCGPFYAARGRVSGCSRCSSDAAGVPPHSLNRSRQRERPNPYKSAVTTTVPPVPPKKGGEAASRGKPLGPMAARGNGRERATAGRKFSRQPKVSPFPHEAGGRSSRPIKTAPTQYAGCRRRRAKPTARARVRPCCPPIAPLRSWTAEAQLGPIPSENTHGLPQPGVVVLRLLAGRNAEHVPNIDGA